MVTLRMRFGVWTLKRKDEGESMALHEPRLLTGC
jgi:hypothetical protein